MPSLIKQLPDTNNSPLNATLSDIEELKLAPKSLKYGKSARNVPSAYVKNAVEWKGFIFEMLKFSVDFRQVGLEILPFFSLLMDFVIQVFLGKCINVGIKFLKLK